MSNDQAFPQSERDRCTDWLHTCRTYLLLVANREMGNDLKSKEGASDVVQETLLQAHRDWGKFFGRTEAELRRKDAMWAVSERYVM
jgi:RNA polymerase sigma-70 factor, ECF subfamily